jgi:acyl-[acyl-carrier-protein] desaturase
MTDVTASPDFDQTARNLLERHLSQAKEWFPHEFIPWAQGRDIVPGAPSATPILAGGVASAVWIGLLTEDNLPHYFHVIARDFPFDSAMGEWSRRWAAEEGRHATAIRDWVSVTRCLDLRALERARMRQVTTGFRPNHRANSLSDGLVYLTLQELATRVSHWNTGAHLDESGKAILRRVALDENLHFLFYRDLTTFLIEADPSAGMLAIDRQVTDFQMPGAAGIEDFARHSSMIAAKGIYSYRVHYEQVLVPVVFKHWRVESLTGLTPEAERARDHTMGRIARLKRVAERIDAPEAALVDVGNEKPL